MVHLVGAQAEGFNMQYHRQHGPGTAAHPVLRQVHA